MAEPLLSCHVKLATPFTLVTPQNVIVTQIVTTFGVKCNNEVTQNVIT